MSFFKKITKELDNLGIGDKKEESAAPSDTAESSEGHRQYGYQSRGQGGPSPAQYYAAPPQPQYQPSSDKPPLPEGWTAQFDQQHQRWFYIELATGRTQWDAPGYHAPPVPSSDSRPPMDPHPSDGSRGYGGGGYGSHGGYGGQSGYGAPGYGPPPPGHGSAPGYAGHNDRAYGGHGGYGGDYGGERGVYGHDSHRAGHDDYLHEEKEKSGKSGMLLGAAGGLAVGAVGGALIANALNDDDSDDEQHSAPPPAPPTDYGYGVAPTDPYAQDGPPAVLPPTDEDGDSVSSSDREEVQEAREEYEEALAEAADSDASSSAHEELEEAREEYEETYEEVYED